MHRVLIADPLGEAGNAVLAEAGVALHELSAEERPRLLDLVGDYDALVVRSTTRVDAALLRAGRRLKVVGRAGAGVDNVDVATATELGILVVNAPSANQIAAAEHTFALLLALARQVPAADAALKRGEWQRNRFMGSELAGKTLGLVGLGRIGQRVAVRARAFEMRVVAHDPYVDPETARGLDVELLPLDELLARADVVSLHLPANAETRGLLDARRLRLLGGGALLVNCARGGLVDEAALLALLESGQLGGAALDVFAQEPTPSSALVQHPRVVATPHIGARTVEAQARIATETARMVVAALAGSLAVSAVNLPFAAVGRRGEPYLRLGERLGWLAGALLAGNLRRVAIELRDVEPALAVPASVAALKGALTPLLGESVNYVNARHVAHERAIGVACSEQPPLSDDPRQLTVTVASDTAEVEIGGAVGADGEPRIVRWCGYPLELRPAGRLLAIESRNVPGVIGRVATLLGSSGVNIAQIHLAQRHAGGALVVLRLDQEPEESLRVALAALPDVRRVQYVEVAAADRS